MEKILLNKYKVHALLLLCIANLFYMHYYIYTTCNIEDQLDITSFIDNIFAIIFDVSVLFLFTCLILRKIKHSLLLCFIMTGSWAFCNILYSRFFFRYISFSSIGQATNLFDWYMVECMINELNYSDLFFVIEFIIFIFLFRKIHSDIKFSVKHLKYFCYSLLFLLFIDLSSHLLFCISDPKLRYLSYYNYRLYFTHIDNSRNMGRPNWTNFHRGSLRTLFTDLANQMQGDIELTQEQEKQISTKIKDNGNRITSHQINRDIQNVIFILVESYTSFTTDMIIDNKEVTPFLNRLRKEPNVYYNGNMKSNITIGQSSDGQFIYMTGLLPLRSIITVSRAKHNLLPALPKKIKKYNPDIESRMVIPTLPSLWEQDAMCQAYGFDYLYSSNDFQGPHSRNLNDEQIFQLAKEIDLKSSKPFFSYILTMSMHGPYNSPIDSTFIIHDKKFCPELTNFLNVCHYTDKQIEKYINHLKENGLYNNSLIIIAPDHQVPENTVNTEQYGITRELPLFIINGNINTLEAWNGTYNQLDVYTTILDCLGIQSTWRGLGNSILSSSYQNSLSNTQWDISEWIILSNYFKTHTYDNIK